MVSKSKATTIDSNAFGGGIRAGDLIMLASSVLDCEAKRGGGVFTYGAFVTIAESTIARNYASVDAGGAYLVPVHATTCTALKLYLEQREAFLGGRVAAPFFISPLGTRVTHCTLDDSFRRLCRKLGLRGRSDAKVPRMHDMRHTMAVEVLRRCYDTGADPERRLPALSTYLGHTHLNYTYWYLHQNPSLMKQAVTRLEHYWEASA